MNSSSVTSIDSGGAGEISLKAYATGFVLSLIFTAIPFGIVMYGEMSYTAKVTAIFSAAVVQILVHLHYFLHLNTSSKARWNVLALLFSVLIMGLIIVGTLWIMYHLNYQLS
ncbi:MAG: cytochrome o ubiquinol oxidase subunit IV [Gammaproteobacteria bacterium]|jgi:cytochrome o ubiquinol oxidase subunit IV